MKRRRKNKNKYKKLILLLIPIIIISIILLPKYNKPTKEIKTNKEINEEQEDKIKLLMVGDNLINDKIYNNAKKDDTYDFKPMYSYIKEITKDYDLAYYNQETILGGKEIGLSSYPAFNSPYEVGDAMIDAGFNLVSLATNHTLDRGEKAIINSLNYWNSKDNVLTAGSYLSNEDRNKINIKEKNNITYTMLNYTYGTNGISIPKGKEYLVNVWPTNSGNPDNDTKYQEYKTQVKEDILRVRDKVDLLIVAMHWGVEYTHIPTKYQEDMASYLSSLGVDIIIGTHPHVIMPITYINNTLVIYSLGNFLSAQDTNNDYNTTVGLLTSIDITKKDNKITLSNLNNDLLYSSLVDNTYKVIPFSNTDIKTYLTDYQRVYNKYSSIVKSINKDIPVKNINN